MARVLPCLLTVILASVAFAQERPDSTRELQLIESTERSEDPLGLDESTGRELERAAARIRPTVSRPTLPAPLRGATLSSIPGVKETAHALDVELRQGAAHVRARMAFRSSARHPAELAYRFPLPPGAIVTRVIACIEARCASATPNDAGARYLAARARSGGGELPVLSAEPIDDGDGSALALRVAPVQSERELAIELEYVAEAPIRGGRARFRLPARGYDPNLAPTRLRTYTRELVELTPADELTYDAWSAQEISAVLGARALRSESHGSCGGVRCTLRYEAAPLATPVLRATWLLLDASPSMEGPARGRAQGALAALLAVLPEATSVRAFAFAARAEQVGLFRAGDAPLPALADALSRDLDGATHLAPVLLRPELARERPRIVVISDGVFDASASESEAQRRARSLGAELVLVQVGDGPARVRIGRTIDAAAEAEQTLHGAPLEPLMDALRQVTQREAKPGLTAGEQRVTTLAPKRNFGCASGDSVCFRIAARNVRWLADEGQGAGAIAALAYESSAREPPQSLTGMPAESVLSMLRTQLVPQARACLRSDRKGRGDYAVELTFHALFAQREAYEVRISGDIPKPLRGCLEALVPKLKVPLFTGRIRVKYPIHTEREPPPPVIELEPELDRTLERAFSGPHALP